MPKLNIDSPFFRFMGKLGDMVALNFLWFVCCLPIITAGASTTALFYTARKLSSDEFLGVRREFFHSFKQNFKQGLVVWLILFLTLALCVADLAIGFGTPGASGSLFRGIGAVLLILWAAVSGYAFPLLARYEYTTRQLFSGAFFMCFAHPTVTITSLALMLWLPVLGFADINAALYFFPIWGLIGGSLSAFVISNLLKPVFDKLESRI